MARQRTRPALVLGLAAAAAAVQLLQPSTALAVNSYAVTNLTADQPGQAAHTDAHLINPWGLSRSGTGPWWVSDQGTGVSTLYNGSGVPQSLVVTIPIGAATPGGSLGTPTGNVFNSTTGFVVSKGGLSGPSAFIFATEDGTISGWNQTVDATHAILAVDKSAAGADYKGLALGTSSIGPTLYAANFHAAKIDVFNSSFAPATLSGSFTDPNLPTGYAPFNVAAGHGVVAVAYALQDATKHNPVFGAGLGFVDIYTPDGRLNRRFISNGALNAPWGLVLAPSTFGMFAGDVLVGNFGDGRILAYTTGGLFQGALMQAGQPIVIPGIWGLAFGNGGQAGSTGTLFFTAGTGFGQHGLFGAVNPA